MKMILKNLSCFALRNLLTCGNFMSTAMHLVENSDNDVPDQYTNFARLIRKVMRLKKNSTLYTTKQEMHI